MFTILIEQHHVFLKLQERISKAIYNHDERLLLQLKQSSQDLFFQIEDNRKRFLETADMHISRQSSFESDLAELVQIMGQAQEQVQSNEKALQVWLDQMKSDVQHRRSALTPRGVLASYVQQKEAVSNQSTIFDSSLPSSNKAPVSSAAPSIPLSPWTVQDKDQETVGHQVNHRS